MPRKFFLFPKSKRHKKSGEIFQLKNERKETELARTSFGNVRKTYYVKEDWALEPFNFSCSQHTTDTIVHNHDESLKIHPSSNGSNRQKCFKMRKVNENGVLRGVIDDFRLGMDASKHSNGKYFKCSRKSSMATTTSLTSLSGNENDESSLNFLNNRDNKFRNISETSESSTHDADKLKTSKINQIVPRINVDEDVF